MNRPFPVPRAAIALCAALLFPVAALALAPATPAPALDAPLLAGEGRLRQSDLAGKVYYVDFWASWCAPCRASFPVLDKLYGRYREQGFVVVGVNQDENHDEARRFADKVPVRFPLVRDDGHFLAEAFAVSGMPTGVLVDRKGIVRHVVRGFRDKEEAELVRAVDAVMKGSQ